MHWSGHSTANLHIKSWSFETLSHSTRFQSSPLLILKSQAIVVKLSVRGQLQTCQYGPHQKAIVICWKTDCEGFTQMYYNTKLLKCYCELPKLKSCWWEHQCSKTMQMKTEFTSVTKLNKSYTITNKKYITCIKMLSYGKYLIPCDTKKARLE